MGYCDILNVCRIVDADGPIASLGNYIFNGVLFDSARNLAVAYWSVVYMKLWYFVGKTLYSSSTIAICYHSKMLTLQRVSMGQSTVAIYIKVNALTFKTLASMKLYESYNFVNLPR